MKGTLDDSGDIVAVHGHLVSQLLFPDIGEQLDGFFPKFIPEKMRRKLAYAATGYLSNTSLMGFVEGGDMATCKYEIPNFRYDFTPIHVNVPVTAWRSVAHSYSTFIMETFLDHLAKLGDNDPLDTKRKLLENHPRYLSVLDAVVQGSDWGQPIESGWGRGIAVSEFAGSVVAQVVEAGVVNNEIIVREVTCAVDCGIVINPDVVRAQIESGIIYGLSMMTEKIEFVDGVVQQRNFDGFPAMRMNRVPKIVSIIVPSEKSPTGIGEIALPPVNAAVSNAIYAATGVRLTKMPLQDAWAEYVLSTTSDSASNDEVTL
jgi:CO/xanthine dehydrogenase Mo-binding subunit